jgi:mannose-6-phosphate isomerase-like protein (cupin superfamily)
VGNEGEGKLQPLDEKIYIYYKILQHYMKAICLFLLHIVAMNTFAQLKPITSGVYHWNELQVKKEAQRESRKIAEGTTIEFAYFGIHATTQEKGATPRPPHAQDSIEELIIIKEGKLKCTIGNKTTELGPGSVLLIPPHEMQSFENSGDALLLIMCSCSVPVNQWIWTGAKKPAAPYC